MERILINTHILSSYSAHKYTHEHTEIHTNNKKISLLSTNSNARARAQKATSAPQTNKWREGKNAAKLNDKRNHKGKLICSIVIICFCCCCCSWVQFIFGEGGGGGGWPGGEGTLCASSHVACGNDKNPWLIKEKFVSRQNVIETLSMNLFMCLRAAHPLRSSVPLVCIVLACKFLAICCVCVYGKV